VVRLRRGDGVWPTARWLERKPDRGGLSNVGFWTLGKYLTALAEEIEKQKLLQPGPTLGDLPVASPPPALPLPGPPPLARRPGAKFKSLEEWLGEMLASFNSDLIAMALVKINYEFLDRLRRAEEVMGEENPVPLHALAAGHAYASDAVVKALEQLNRNAESRVRQKRGIVAIGDMGGSIVHPATMPPGTTHTDPQSQPKARPEPQPERKSPKRRTRTRGCRPWAVC